MANRRISLLVGACALLIVAPQASAQGLPDPRTHIDLAEVQAQLAGQGDPAAPRLTYLDPDTKLKDVRRGFLYVRARCDARCVVDVTAFTAIAGKEREVATTRRTLPANKVRRIKLRIRSDVRRRIAAGARFSFEALPLPVPAV